MRPEKTLLLDEIKDKINESDVMIITRYNKFSPNDSWEFRDTLRKNDGIYTILKKRMLIKAFDDCKLPVKLEELEGQIGVVFAKGDGISATKAVCKHKEALKDEFFIIKGHFDGVEFSSDQVVQLSKLPSMNEMRAQFVGLLEAPMSQTISVMQNLLTSLMYCLDSKAKKSESA